jgi:hypothetical protein
MNSLVAPGLLPGSGHPANSDATISTAARANRAGGPNAPNMTAPKQTNNKVQN